MNWKQLLSSNRIGKTAKADSFRSAFEQDYDRIIFSHPFRRLQDKTQVHPLPEYDFVHTRLTHSLEVSSVGRSLGKKVGESILEKYPDLSISGFSSYDFGAIVAAAALAHDIGNPPFGHSGESAISDFFNSKDMTTLFKSHMTANQWADIIDFEGNAQGFRLMNQTNGLQLTNATLAAFTKYPRPSLISSPDKSKKSQKKYGYFQSDKNVFEDLATEVGLKKYNDEGIWSRHPLAFLVEAADDICYQVIDLEDGCRLELVSYEETVGLLGSIIGNTFDPAKLAKYSSDAERIGVLRAMAIGKLVDECVTVFLDHEPQLLAGEFDRALTGLIPSKDILKKIEKISIIKIYQSRKVLEKEAAGFEVLPGLLEAFTTAVFHYYIDKTHFTKKLENLIRLLPEDVRTKMDQSSDSLYELLMATIDFISGMTDSHAISLYRKIKGISMPI
jgi:dGTPase